jgi:GrpB-like predicted nucleotidyltransferase (UPF0157 family)
VVIEEYNENWIKQFTKIKNIIENNLSKIIGIEHIGSTAIIGMCAKPIIDIDIIIDNINDFNITKNELEFIGYYHTGDQGIIGREAFNRANLKYNEILDEINHHLYVCTKDNEELQRHILFRNYLNNNEKAKEEYYKLKKEIIKKIGNENRGKYVLIKETEYRWFFEKIIKEAKNKYK